MYSVACSNTIVSPTLHIQKSLPLGIQPSSAPIVTSPSISTPAMNTRKNVNKNIKYCMDDYENCNGDNSSVDENSLIDPNECGSSSDDEKNYKNLNIKKEEKNKEKRLNFTVSKVEIPTTLITTG